MRWAFSTAFVEKYFTGTATTIEGIGIREIAEECVRRHRDAYGDNPIYRTMLDAGGDYAFRIRGEEHAWTPESVSKLQHAVRGNLPDDYRAFAKSINEQSERLLTLRGLMQFKPAEKPIPLSEVEPAAEIVKRFSTGAMSFGSISREAHTTLAIAMNRIGGRSNTGEGGEEADRFVPLPNGDSMRSRIKQVASGRFGRHDRISRQRRRHPDQDGAGRQARRGRPASRLQGRQEYRARAPRDAGCRPDLAAAASRHLFHRRPGAAHSRPEDGQREGAHLGQAGVGSGRRQRSPPALPMPRGPHHDLRL